MAPAARRRATAILLVLPLVAAACRGSSNHPALPAPAVPDPARSVVASPDYDQACAPSGLDNSDTCVEVTLQAIDNARAAEGVKAMALPSDFARLPVPEQVFAVVNAERVDRGLPAFTGMSADLNGIAAVGAQEAKLPPKPGRAYGIADSEWIGAIANALDADFDWMYYDGPGSGLPGCRAKGDPGCWVDRHVILDSFGPGTLVLGAAIAPTADTGQDPGGPSLALELAAAKAAPGPLTYTWVQVLADTAAGALRPRAEPPHDQSSTGIPDPSRSVAPNPDFTSVCADGGIDVSSACIASVLRALNAARAAEGVKPMVLPAGFAGLTVPEQLLVAIDLERIDRGLAPFAGLTGALDQNAQRGADGANDPPDPGSGYTVADTEWAGGSSNGLDAVYGWMYDDGVGSGNLDCTKAGAAGCWGHRHGILDAFGTVGTLVMGAAVNVTGDSTPGDKGGTSMAATLAVTTKPAHLDFVWSA